MLKPTFALTIGALRSATDNAAGGPRRISIARTMDVAADGGQIVLSTREGINLLDEVKVELGHDGENELVLSGAVAALRPTFTGVHVTVLGTMQKLLDLRTAAWYDNQSTGAIARDLIGQAGLQTGTVDDGPTLPRYAVDGRQSAYAHLRRLADRLGYELYATREGAICFHGLGAGAGLDAGGGLLAGAASAAGSAVGALLGGGSEGYQYGQHLLQGEARRHAPTWSQIVVGGESPMSREGDSTAHWLTVNDSDYQGEAGNGSGVRLILDGAARTKDIANRFASGQLVTAERGVHRVIIRVLGRPQLDLGSTIEVRDAPDELLNGRGYIRALHHHFDQEHGFVTDVCVALGGGG